MLKEVILIVNVFLASHQPVQPRLIPMPDLATCWDKGKEFTDIQISDDMRQKGIIGLSATCAWQEKPAAPTVAPGTPVGED